MARYKQSAIVIGSGTDDRDTRFLDGSVATGIRKGHIKSCYVKKIQIWNDLGESDLGFSILIAGGDCTDGGGTDGYLIGTNASTRLTFFDDNTDTGYDASDAPRVIFECRVSRKSRVVLDLPYTGLKFTRGVRVVTDQGDFCYVTITYRQFA